MQIKASQLLAIVALLQRVVPKRSTLPITAGILFGHHRAVVTNLDQTMIIRLPEAEDAYVVTASTLAELLKSIGGSETLTITLNKERRVLDIEAHASSFTLTVLDAEEFPPVHEWDPDLPTAEGKIDGEAFMRALDILVPYAAADDSRPVLHGVVVDMGKEPTTMAAADGYRLAWEPVPDFPVLAGEKSILFDRKVLAPLAAMFKAYALADVRSMSVVELATARKSIEVRYNKNMIGFAAGKIGNAAATLQVQLVQGTFPNYDQLIPKDPICTVTVDAFDLATAVKRVRLMARDSSNIVRLEWDETSLKVSSKAEEIGSSKVIIEAKSTYTPETKPGEDGAEVVTADMVECHFALAAPYIQEYVDGKRGPLTMAFRSKSSPVVLSLAGRHSAIIMPMYVNWGDPDDVLKAKAEAAAKAEKEEEEAKARKAAIAADPVPKYNERVVYNKDGRYGRVLGIGYANGKPPEFTVKMDDGETIRTSDPTEDLVRTGVYHDPKKDYSADAPQAGDVPSDEDEEPEELAA